MKDITKIELALMKELTDANICNNAICKRAKFVDYDDWEDDYSHNEIDEARIEFVDYANKYLEEKNIPYTARLSTYCAFVESK